ncbi:hypothetical protein ACT048_20615 [Ectopseudomonas khazarica]|uniref:hypothetical protein n=1 Tax=Ectopseudomonas khazarica TaxID=2502979 RepID=UPI004034763B
MHKPTDDLPKQHPITTPPRAAEIADQVLAQPSSESATTSKPQKLPDRLLERLWMKMTEMYGHRWTSSFGDNPNPDCAWATVLQGLNGQQLANGLNILTHKGEEFDWPPPANVFRSLCLETVGLPSEDEAWAQALRGTYAHEAVRIAAKATGTFDLRAARLDNKPLRQVFARNYAIVRARAVMGKPLDGEIPKGIGHDQKTPMQVQFAASHREARDLILAQGLPTNPHQARELLMAKMGLKRRKAPEVHRDA